MDKRVLKRITKNSVSQDLSPTFLWWRYNHQCICVHSQKLIISYFSLAIYFPYLTSIMDIQNRKRYFQFQHHCHLTTVHNPNHTSIQRHSKAFLTTSSATMARSNTRFVSTHDTNLGGLFLFIHICFHWWENAPSFERTCIPNQNNVTGLENEFIKHGEMKFNHTELHLIDQMER